MLNTRTKLYFSLTLALSLAACGGSKTSEPAPQVTQVTQVTPAPKAITINTSGKVIDGYVVGATVWLDFNGDGIHDPQTEPSTTSVEAGDYNFNFTEEEASCVPYATTYVDVPVGAMDLDLGEVTEAYQMAFPPSIAPITNGDIRNISPLTSVIWEQLSSQLSRDENLTCERLKQDSNLRDEITSDIEGVMRNLVAHYNLSEQQIYSDFIATNDSETYDRAQSIVTGLKAAYKHQKALEKTHPDATEIRVNVYQSSTKDTEFSFNKAWYREVVVFLDTGFFSEIVKLTDNASLSQVDVILEKLNRVDQPWGDQDLKGLLKVRTDAYRNNDNTYRCSIIEGVTFDQDGVNYALQNSFGDSLSFASVAECSNHDLEQPYERNYSYVITQENTTYSTELYFRDQNEAFNILANWINIKDKSDSLAATEMISHLSSIAIGWDEAVLVDTAYWRKRMEYDNIVIDKDNDNNWIKSTRNEDNTTTYECSTEGINWIPCKG